MTAALAWHSRFCCERIFFTSRFFVTFRHVETLFVQGRTLKKTVLLLASRVCLPSANQYQVCVVQGFFLGRIKFLHVEKPYCGRLMRTSVWDSNSGPCRHALQTLETYINKYKINKLIAIIININNNKKYILITRLNTPHRASKSIFSHHFYVYFFFLDTTGIHIINLYITFIPLKRDKKKLSVILP